MGLSGVIIIKFDNLYHLQYFKQKYEILGSLFDDPNYGLSRKSKGEGAKTLYKIRSLEFLNSYKGVLISVHRSEEGAKIY